MTSQEKEECAFDHPDLVDSFMDFLQLERNYSAHTIRAYRCDLLSYLRYAKRMDFNALDPKIRQMRGYLSDQDQAGYARKTINRRLSSLRTFFRWLSVSDLSSSGVVTAVSGPKIPKHLPAVLTEAEVDVLFCALDDELQTAQTDASGDSPVHYALALRDKALFEFLYATGARVSELAGVQVDAIDFSSNQVVLFGKGSKERVVPLYDECTRALKSYLDNARPLLAANDTTALFVSTRGKPLSADAIRKVFKEQLRIAGLDSSLSPHAMRHTFATELLDGGADLRTVQELLGHASLSTTQIYTHLTPERLKAAHNQAHPRA